MADRKEIREQIAGKGLKVTPQRMAILEAVYDLNNHPTADQIKEYIQENHPSIAVGTIYKTLDTLGEKGLIERVKTEKDVMRYDIVTKKHHHLYSNESDRIEDYFDDELNKMLEEYFRKHQIKNFKIDDFKIHLTGKFTDNN
ncbi:MAG: transcriptional repressor [Bacteroidales bacterium]|nr:transcriptional repressor [Bacteroidales bacterium]MCF8333791.1 transcriptional repressor [Bacteroidales bacterium]